MQRRFPHRAWRRTILLLAAPCLGLALTASDGQPASDDPRSAMHGISAVRGEHGAMLVFFSSAGYPPRVPAAGDDWPHDVYVSRWDPATGRLDPPRAFLRRPEAQEPVAAAQESGGRILLTMEDGWNTPNTVTQRYGIYQRDLAPVRAYPSEVQAGGHSGDAAAVGRRFAVAYSEGWIHGGGVADLGSGNGIYARVYDAGGGLLHHIDVAPRQRAWWPRLAGSPGGALLIWQAFAPDRQGARLVAATLDLDAGRAGPPVVLLERVRFYTYSVAWLPAVGHYLVLGTEVDAKGEERGQGMLVDAGGRVVARLMCMPATVREAGIAVARPSSGARDSPIVATAYAPAGDGRLLQLRATPANLALTGVLNDAHGNPVAWQPTGSVALWTDSGELQWLSLSRKGVVQSRFRPSDAVAPDNRDLCAG